jgi:probable HAF family extracellular repeat protein
MHDLGTLGGTGSQAFGINASGQVVGQAYTAGDAAYHAFLYDGTTMQDLGTLPGGTTSIAHGINDSGRVVGEATVVGAAIAHAFLYIGSAMLDLGTLGGNYSWAYGINNSGQVVGSANTPTTTHAFLYDGSAMLDLNDQIPSDSGWVLESAQAINDSGQIAGYGTNPAGRLHAFLLTPTSAPRAPVTSAALVASLPR